LQTNINTLTTNVGLTGSTLAANIASTGSTLQTNINNLSNTYATITNLASTGSSLNTKINDLSGASVLTFGNQTVSGVKTFQDVTPNLVINSNFDGSDGNAKISLRGNGNDKLIIAQDAEDYDYGNNYIKSHVALGIYSNDDSLVANFVDDVVQTINLTASQNISAPSISNNYNDIATEITLTPQTPKIVSDYDGNEKGIYFSPYGDDSRFATATFSHDKVAINGSLNLNDGLLDDGKHRNVYQFIDSITITGNPAATPDVAGTYSRSSGGTTSFVKIGDANKNIVFLADSSRVYGGYWGLYCYSNEAEDYDYYFENYSPLFASSWGSTYGQTITTTSLSWKAKNYNGIFLADNSTAVLVTGNQTISGNKTFIGNHIISGNTTVSGSINISGNYDIYSQIEDSKKLALAYAIAL
jgi:hypothetical protein